MKTSYKITPIALAMFLSFFLLSGCGTTFPPVKKLATPSGRPEVTIPKTNIQTVMDDVAAWLAVNGKPISETGVYTISTSFTIGNSWPYKSTFTIIQNGENISLYGATYYHDSYTELTTESYYDDMQKQLTQIAEFIKARSSTEITK